MRPSAPYLCSLLLLSCTGCGACDEPPVGEPTDEVFGVKLPPGSRLLGQEAATGPDGEITESAWLTNSQPIDEVLSFLAPGLAPAESYVLADGSRISVRPRELPPPDLPPPFRALGRDPPDDLGSWIWVRRIRPAECPPCPEGFNGTVAPGCECTGQALGEAVEEVRGVRLPENSRVVDHENGESDSGRFDVIWLVSPEPPGHVADFFRYASHTEDAETTEFRMADNTRVRVTAIDDIPKRRSEPTRPVVEAPPGDGYQSWIIVSYAVSTAPAADEPQPATEGESP